MSTLKYALALCLTAAAVPQAMACYTVYNRANQVVYSGPDTPIDMSYQIHQRLPAVFPSGHMVFGNDIDCPLIDTRRASPLLTNVAGRMAPRSGGYSGRPPRAGRN